MRFLATFILITILFYSNSSSIFSFHFPDSFGILFILVVALVSLIRVAAKSSVEKKINIKNLLINTMQQNHGKLFLLCNETGKQCVIKKNAMVAKELFMRTYSWGKENEGIAKKQDRQLPQDDSVVIFSSSFCRSFSHGLNSCNETFY